MINFIYYLQKLNYHENEIYKCKKNFINKLIKIFIFYWLISFKNNNIKYYKKCIEIDNKINEQLYEYDMNFSEYSTKVKVIAFYFPQFIYYNDNYKFKDKVLNEWKFVKKAKPLFNYHNQPRKIDTNYINFENKNCSKIQIIKNQIKLAKNHGIYGFGINYYWLMGDKLYEEPINIFLNDKEINFPFFLIWNNDKYELIDNEYNKSIIIEQNYSENDVPKFIEDIKKYLICKNYIRIKGKSILGIYDPLVIINLNNFIYKLRKYAKKLGIELYILGTINENKYLNSTQLFDALFEFPPQNLNISELINNDYYFFYKGLIYKMNNKNENNYYRSVMLEWDNSPVKKNPTIFNEYSPEKLYLAIKIIINRSKNEQKKNNNTIILSNFFIISIIYSFFNTSIIFYQLVDGIIGKKVHI